MSNVDPQEFEELSIGSVSGLQAFLRNAQAQYNVGLGIEADSPEAIGQREAEALHDAFQTVRHTANRLIATVQDGGELGLSEAAQLQKEYDDLVHSVARLKRSVERRQEAPAHTAEASPASSQPEPQRVPVTAPEEKPPESPPEPTKPPRSVKPKVENKTSEESLKKPRTGSLSIASDDTEVIDAKSQLTAKSSAKKKTITKDRTGVTSAKQPATEKQPTASKSELKKLQTVIRRGRRQYHDLKKRYPTPNPVQTLLFEEAREGIEHLELLAKRPNRSSVQLPAVAEVASHIKYALEGVQEMHGAESTAQSDKQVPVVTESVSQTDTAKSSRENKNSGGFVSFVPTSVTTKKPSVAKRTIPRRLQTLPKPADIYETESLTETYLTAPRYQQHINTHYSSPEAFEQIIDATITKVESDTIDAIEKWLGDLPASVFSFLKDMKVTDIETFADRSYEEVTTDLAQQNLKYETFVAWRDMIDEMLEVVPQGKTMPFGQLFALWLIELDMQEL